MSTISAIDTLEAIVDGDTIVPGMSYSSPSGIGLTQFYNPQTGDVSPKFAKNNILFYPTCYSSNQGKYLAPDGGSYQWYYNNPDSSDAEILVSQGSTTVRDTFKDIFLASTYTSSGVTYPALQLKGEIASETQLSDVNIYFKGTFNGIEVTTHATISVKTTVGDAVEIVIQSVSVDANGNEQDQDTVLDYNGESLKLTAYLTNNGEVTKDTVASRWKWYRLVKGSLTQVSNVTGVTEISANVIRLYDTAIEGTEEYFAEYTTDDSQVYRQGIQVSDIHDPYYISIGRSVTSNLVRKTDADIVYTPKVINRNTGQEDTTKTWTFNFSATDAKGDTLSGVISHSDTNKVNVTAANVATYGQIIIYISAKTGNS
jgi:hypothetical protein